MIDYFGLLNEPRRPWLDEDLLKGKFLELSAEAHPDRVHGAPEAEKQRANQRYAELNSAYNCLREPKTRLRHLFELETRAKPKEIEQVHPATMELCMEFGQLCRGADGFLAECAGVTSPLLKVEMFERAMEWTDRLNVVQRKLNTRREELTAELKLMNMAWETAAAAEAQSRDEGALPAEAGVPAAGPASGGIREMSLDSGAGFQPALPGILPASQPRAGSPDGRQDACPTALPLAQLERAVREFGYLARWSGQIQERVVQLSL